jgi:hypothetical protein
MNISAIYLMSASVALNGCVAVAHVGVAALPGYPRIESDPDDSFRKHVPTTVTYSTPDSITISAEQFNFDEAESLIQEHCDGPYTFTAARPGPGPYTIEAKCE